MSAAILVTLLTQFQNCTVLTDVNGCSVPFGFDVPLKDVFTPACLNHDVCYRCGQTYGWSQKQCDDGFKNLMYGLCHDNQKVNKVRERRFLSGLSEKYQTLKEMKEKIKRGWEEATKNASSRDEINRIAVAMKEVIYLTTEFVFRSDPLEKCKLAADVFYKMVDTFGVYKFRYQNKAYCTESCAKKLGNPFL